jgi:GNAT superfamily N-acetyltransferase
MRFAVVTPDVRERLERLRPNLRSYWDRRMSAMSDDHAIWVAAWSDEDEPIGWVILNWPIDDRGVSVEDLYVREDQRNQGVGTALLLEVERVARASGITSIWLAVNPDDNPDALRLYERLGYVADGAAKYLDGVYDGYEDWVIDVTKRLSASNA